MSFHCHAIKGQKPTPWYVSARWIFALELMQYHPHLCYSINKQAEDRIKRPSHSAIRTHPHTKGICTKIYYSILQERENNIKIQIAWH